MIGEDYEQRPNFCLQEYTGVTINDAVYERQLELENRYDIDIEYSSQKSRGDCNTTVITSVKADDDTYDLIFNAMTEGAASLVVQNVLTDMAALPYLNFEKPWWSQTMLDAFTYNDHIYLAVGGASPSYYLSAQVTLFNVEQAKAFGLPNLYDLVTEGKWTVDKMGELMSMSMSDLNGDGTMDAANDFMPLVLSAECGRSLFVASGGKPILRGEDGSFVMNLASEESIAIMDALRAVFADRTTSVQQESAQFKIQEFTTGHTMFAMTAMMFGNMELREMEAMYGVLPMPKRSEEQKDYITCGNPFAPCGMCIPRSASDVEMSALIAEAMGFLGEEILRPAVYNVTIHGKLAQDKQSSDMLEIIYNDIYFDFWAAYEFGKMSKALRSYIIAGDGRNGDPVVPAFSSFYASKSQNAQNELNKTIQAMESLGSTAAN